MIWQNPWALAGLATVALPVVIHLLSRTQASVQKFPTLRFLDVSRLRPTRSPRITDVLLLVVRAAILACAALALAGPLFASAARSKSANAKISRAIIVESTGATADASHHTESLMARAQELAAGSSASTIVQTARVIDQLEGVEAWLRLQGGRGEIAILSNFRASSIDSAALATVPPEFGLRLERATASPVSDTAVAVFHSQDASVRVTAERGKTVAEWTNAPTPTAVDTVTFTVHTAATEKSAAEKIINAVQHAIGAQKPDSAHPIVLVYENAADFAQVAADAKPLSKRWMAALATQLRTNAHFISALTHSVVATDTTLSRAFVALGRDKANRIVVSATQIARGGRDVLAIFVRAELPSVTSTELIAALSQAQSEAWETGGLEPTRLSDAALAKLQRSASMPASPPARGSYANADESDARWFWFIVLLLLGGETWLRMRQARLSPKIAAPL